MDFWGRAVAFVCKLYPADGSSPCSLERGIRSVRLAWDSDLNNVRKSKRGLAWPNFFQPINSVHIEPKILRYVAELWCVDDIGGAGAVAGWHMHAPTRFLKQTGTPAQASVHGGCRCLAALVIQELRESHYSAGNYKWQMSQIMSHIHTPQLGNLISPLH